MAKKRNRKRVVKPVSKAKKMTKGRATRETGYLGLQYANGVILEESRSALSFPEALNTYQKMSHDPIIKAANNVLDIMISRVNWEFEVPENASERTKNAAKFLNYCMHNFDDTYTWKSFIEEIGSYRIYGFHVAEKIYSKIKEGEYIGKLRWGRLTTRSQVTIAKWNFDSRTQKLESIDQDTARLAMVNYAGRLPGRTGYINIPRNKFMLFNYGVRRENPEGDSPLKGCYIPWKYKRLIEDYEAVGVAKDLGGIPVIGIDAVFMAKAQSDPTSEEASVLRQIQIDAEALHAGEKNSFFMPIAYTDSGKELFSFKLVGIDGGGKQYNVDDIIKRKQQEILMLYLADVLKLGADSHGSFALAESKNNLLAFAIDHHLQLITDVINNDLIPQTLALNGWGDLTKEEMPKVCYKDLDQVSMDDLSKFVQRVASTGFLPKTPEVVNEILEKSGFDYRVDDEVEVDDEDFTKLFPENNSNAGEGMKTPGEGTSKGGAVGDDPSVGNTENT